MRETEVTWKGLQPQEKLKAEIALQPKELLFSLPLAQAVGWLWLALQYVALCWRSANSSWHTGCPCIA